MRPSAIDRPDDVCRRDFLRGIAASLLPACAATCRAAAAADSSTPLKLGLVTYDWGKDWDVPTLIDRCAATGFRGVELRTTHAHGVELSLDAGQRADVRRRFADSPVALVGLGTTCEYHAADPAVVRANVEASKAWVRLCADVGGGGIKVRPNALVPDVPPARTLEQIGLALNEVARHAADHGVQVRLEVHGRGTADVPGIRTIMDVADHPQAVVCWNCNPEDLAGAGFEANFDLLEKRLGIVHIHDLRRPEYPWPALFRRLRRCAAPTFTGWTLLEDHRPPADAAVAMRENETLWRRLALEPEAADAEPAAATR